jgi:hypothetical protein
MSLQPHEQATLDIIREADGMIQHVELCRRVRKRMFPGSARTAGVFSTVDKALKTLLGEGLVEEANTQVFRITTKGRLQG